MTVTQRMENGLIYDPMDDEVASKQAECLKYLNTYNQMQFGEFDKTQELLEKMFEKVGKDCFVQPPFYANWGGAHVTLGDNVYANFNLTLVDDGHIYVGNKVMFGPNVTVVTATHPILPSLRDKGLQFNADVHIGNNVWIGAGSVILPGVTIGDNTVVGAGSIVTKDLPSNVVAVGSPCKVMREINDHDKEYYFKDKKIDIPID